MNRPVRVLNAWSRTGDVVGPLLERAGYSATVLRVDSPAAARAAALAEPFDLCLTEMAHAGGGAAVLAAISDLPRPPSGVFVNASPLGLRHGVAQHARAGMVLPFRLVDLLSLVEAVLALHRVAPPHRPLFPLARLVESPDDLRTLVGPSVMIDSARATLAALARDRVSVRLTGGCPAVRADAARLIHRRSAATRLCAVQAHDDVLAAWQLTGTGTLYIPDLAAWAAPQVARLNRCLEHDPDAAPRLVIGPVGGPLPALLRRVLEAAAPVELPTLEARRADLFALSEGLLCRGNRARWPSGRAFAEVLKRDWKGLGVRDLISHYTPSEAPAARAAG